MKKKTKSKNSIQSNKKSKNKTKCMIGGSNSRSNSNELRKMKEKRLSKFDPEYSRLRNTMASRIQTRYKEMNDREQQNKVDFLSGIELRQNFNTLPLEITTKIYKYFINPGEPTLETCANVKKICNISPEYCKTYNLKERYHKICKEMKKTNLLIHKFYNDIPKSQRIYEEGGEGESISYEPEEYIESMDLDRVEKNVLMQVINPIEEQLNVTNTFGPYDDDDIVWAHILNRIHETSIYDPTYSLGSIMDIFGKKLYESNSNRYYPLIIEKLKQKILSRYFDIDV